MNEIEQIEEFRDGMPAPRPQVRDAARAALMESMDPPPPKRRRLRRRALALAGTVAVAAAAIVIVIGPGNGPGVKPEAASAAELRRLAEVFPRLTLAGPWQILSTEGSAAEGRTTLRFEENGHRPGEGSAELRWSSDSEDERAQQLTTKGFAKVGAVTTTIGRPFLIRTRPPANPHAFEDGTAQVYVSREPGQELFEFVGIWREHDSMFELRAPVEDLGNFERLLERLTILDGEEWILALQPGGAVALSEHAGALVKLEYIKVGETPDGHPIYTKKGYLEVPEASEKLDVDSPLPIIYRDGDEVRIVVKKFP